MLRIYLRPTKWEFAGQGQTWVGKGRLGNCMFKRSSPADYNGEPCIEHIKHINFLMVDYFNPIDYLYPDPLDPKDIPIPPFALCSTISMNGYYRIHKLIEYMLKIRASIQRNSRHQNNFNIPEGKLLIAFSWIR